jgi:hypothetical protein
MNAQPIDYESLIPKIGVYSPYSPLVLVVEALTGRDCSQEDATAFRSNLLEGELTPPHAPWLLMPTGEAMYLWKRETALHAPADFVAPSIEILQEHVPERVRTGSHYRRDALEFAFTWWLRRLVYMIQLPAPDREADQMLVRSGVYDQIHHGELRTKDVQR